MLDFLKNKKYFQKTVINSIFSPATLISLFFIHGLTKTLYEF